jgi:hypothetical protein
MLAKMYWQFKFSITRDLEFGIALAVRIQYVRVWSRMLAKLPKRQRDLEFQ